MSKRSMDINADLGEGCAYDAELMPHITSASIACGGHAGDAATMRESLRLAAIHEVVAGAHPSFPDRVGFGRRNMDLAPIEVKAIVREQIETLKEIASRVGVPIRYAKPHGALYHEAARDSNIARAVAEGVASAGIKILYGQAGSILLLEAQAANLRIVAEGFVDRPYLPDGNLLNRDDPDSILGHRDAIEQGLDIALKNRALTNNNETLKVKADTLCVHGATLAAVAIARDLHSALYESGVRVASPSP